MHFIDSGLGPDQEEAKWGLKLDGGGISHIFLAVVQFADVVVSVARKMDASLWPALFAAVGPPGT